MDAYLLATVANPPSVMPVLLWLLAIAAAFVTARAAYVRMPPLYRLRSLYMLAALLCLWVASSRYWIRQRHEFLKPLPHAPIYPPLVYGYGRAIEHEEYDRAPAAPGMLWIFGEPPIQFFYFPASDLGRIKRAKRLFPEATVHVEPPKP